MACEECLNRGRWEFRVGDGEPNIRILGGTVTEDYRGLIQAARVAIRIVSDPEHSLVVAIVRRVLDCLPPEVASVVEQLSKPREGFTVFSRDIRVDNVTDALVFAPNGSSENSAVIEWLQVSGVVRRDIRSQPVKLSLGDLQWR